MGSDRNQSKGGIYVVHSRCSFFSSVGVGSREQLHLGRIYSYPAGNSHHVDQMSPERLQKIRNISRHLILGYFIHPIIYNLAVQIEVAENR